MKYIDFIDQVQQRATTMLPGIDTLSYIQRLHKLKLPTLVYHRLRGDIIEVYTILHGIYDIKISPCLTIRSTLTSCVLRGHNIYLLKKDEKS